MVCVRGELLFVLQMQSLERYLMPLANSFMYKNFRSSFKLKIFLVLEVSVKYLCVKISFYG
jgi:hypothetical protein